MATRVVSYYENYTPAADVLVMGMCFVFLILIWRAYINRTKSFFFLRAMIYLLFAAAASDILYHVSMNRIGEIPNIIIYIFRFIFHMCLFTNLWLYVLYLRASVHVERKSDRRFIRAGVIGYFVILFLEIFTLITRTGFYIREDNSVHTGFPVFLIGYVHFLSLLIVMIFKYRNRVYKQVLRGVIETIGVSVLIIIVQQIHGQSSFTVATFMFPIYALLYLIHSNPYDIETGSVSESAFEDLVYISGARKRDLYFMSLYMHDFEGKGRKYPKEIQNQVRRFMVKFFRSPMLFQISGGHMILVVDKAKDPDYEESGRSMLAEFNKVYPILKVDYKIVFFDSYEKLSEENDYVGFVRFMHSRIEENSFVKVTSREVDDYMNYKYIVNELSDIAEKEDLRDPRVKLYCQPVYNIKSGRFDTAEALMRIDLPYIGIVFPDVFIPIAEKNGYIYPLTKIILAKTCDKVKELTENGYDFKRISVNFSVYDLREESFTKMVQKIIGDSGIDYGKIAIELTESQNESDFEVMKEKIEELKGSGIKFYLDDFGTGYSNFERIMELPFDIVKFDRSLVIASGNNEKFRTIVSNLARMFNEVQYAVLYEGIEDDSDEMRCIDMSAKYLQGYKYSKPIPAEKLTEFFEKAEKS